MARVFILEKLDERNFSVEPAKLFGNVIHIFDGKSKRPSIWADDFKKEVSKRFSEHRFNPDEDYFCIVGYMVPIIQAVVELILDYDQVRVLFFSAQDQHYLPRILGDKNDIDGEITEAGTESGAASS